MKYLGFRADSKAPRYALVEVVDDQFNLLNAKSESKLTFPLQCADQAAQLTWFFREIERIFHEHNDIHRVVIKSNEFIGTDSKVRRFSSYIEATLTLYCGLNNIPVASKVYASLSTRSAEVREHAIARVGQTVRYWDNKMADAVIAAWWGAINP